MRTSVIVWSTVSGIVLGLLAGVALLVVLMIASAALPQSATRWVERARTFIIVASLLLPTIAGAILGYLEGRLKAQG